MTTDTEKIRGLAEDVMSNKKCNAPTKSSAGCKYRHQFDGCVCCDCILGRLDQLLSLLPKPCEECGGSKEVTVSGRDDLSGGIIDIQRPCPICSAGNAEIEEFVKESHRIIGKMRKEICAKCKSLWPNKECSKTECKTIQQIEAIGCYVGRLCTHLTAQAKRVEGLDKSLEKKSRCLGIQRSINKQSEAKIAQLEGEKKGLKEALISFHDNTLMIVENDDSLDADTLKRLNYELEQSGQALKSGE